MNDKTLLTAKHVAAMLSVTPRTVERWAKAAVGDFPQPLYIGRRRYWNAGSLSDWTEQLPRKREAS